VSTKLTVDDRLAFMTITRKIHADVYDRAAKAEAVRQALAQ
jgi:hypothetical protein